LLRIDHGRHSFATGEHLVTAKMFAISNGGII
jgi:hypothetical protein